MIKNINELGDKKEKKKEERVSSFLLHLASTGKASAGPIVSAASCKLSKKW